MNRNYTELVSKSEGNMDARRILEDGYQCDLQAIRDIIEASTFQNIPDPPNPNSTGASTSTSFGTTGVRDPNFTQTKGRKKQRVKDKFERKKPITTEFGGKPPNKHLI